MVLVSEDHRARCPQNNVSMRERFHEFYTVTEKKKSDISSSEAETALLWPQLSVTGGFDWWSQRSVRALQRIYLVATKDRERRRALSGY